MQTVNVDASYTGKASYRVLKESGAPPVHSNPPLLNVQDLVTKVNSIDVSAQGNISTTDGGEYDYDLISLDPNAIVDNGVALSGRFSGTSGAGAIQFGTIDGTATLLPGEIFTPYPDYTGARNTGLVSLYSLDYDVRAQVTTHLDENGLITPTVTVTGGIDMSGSRIGNLGAGVDPDDAVTVAQLETAIASSRAISNGGSVSESRADGDGALAGGDGSEADGAGAIALGLDNTATGNGAVAIGDPNVATGTGAVAIGANNTATGNGAVALGNGSAANGDGAVALGNGATASPAGSVAIGGAATATGANSVALGAGSVADQANTVSVGAAGAERRVTNVAAGVATTDAVNVGQLAAATANLAAASTQLQNNIDAEAAARANADTALQANIDAEAAARESADVRLADALDVESMTRAQVDFQLSQRLEIQEAAMEEYTAGLASESAARLAADNALSARIDAVGTRLDAFDSRLAILDDRISSSTAVATAMSGNAFLPDMKFNLTANVATYDGAHAGSLQLGALVSPHVALNAGVATGFNREGKTAARAGVTIGF